jgi:hypothetical protein
MICCMPSGSPTEEEARFQLSRIRKADCIYTVGHKKTHQNVFYHNIHKTRPILKRFGGLLLI